ncbi:flagellar hook-length control protein FliK [Pelagibius marinus]|uniref:flagellar hook-length control protein FliK n=1 Tax=Pelagibius marinus TaxID=2762760 RepID=UPI0018723414|nr:flagellar hook-length control protein FliK [Pelagibius marinus]
MFDSLLREEEARYENDTRSAQERTEATRPVHEDSYDDYGHEEALRDEPVEEAREELPEQPADDYEASGESEPEADDSQAESHEAAPADASQENDAAEATTADDGGDSADATAETPVDGEAAAAATEAGAPATGPARSGAPGAQQANAAAFTVPGQDTRANTPAGVKTEKTGPAAAAQGTPANAAATAAQSATDPATTTEETTALPASAAAPAAKAAGKASETATSKAANPTAEAHRQSPSAPPAPPAEPGKRPAAGTPAAAVGQAVTVETSEGLSSRPSVTLGGGSATAALAQNGETPIPAAKQAKGNGAAPDGAQQATAANKPAPQAGQATKGQDIAAAASDKAAQALSPAATSGGSDGAGASTQQPAGMTPMTGAAAPAGGTVHNTSFAETLANARNGAAADPAEQIAVQVRRAQVAGQEQINIKLHPAELGRIEVKLESNQDGTLRAVISAERSETLDLLQRDARGLERALQEAGVKTDSGSLNFNLRGQNQGQEQQAGGDSAAGRGSFDSAARNAGAGEEAQPVTPQPASYHDGALDIRV